MKAEGYERFGKSIREVEVQWDIDDNKCAHCADKPCISSCPIESFQTSAILLFSLDLDRIYK